MNGQLNHSDFTRTMQRVSKLFLSYVNPHKPAISQRIADWLKDILQEADVNTAVFKAHSVGAI